MCRAVELSREQVRCWYESRACEIEHLSGQVDGAVQLVKLAIDKSVEVYIVCLTVCLLVVVTLLVHSRSCSCDS